MKEPGPKVPTGSLGHPADDDPGGPVPTPRGAGRRAAPSGARIPTSVYRLRLHAGFDFAAAAAALPGLARLGIGHVQCSPIGVTPPGHRHVADPTRIDPLLGGRAGFEHFANAAHAHGVFVLVECVPDHVDIAGGHNPWWQDVLENGEASAFAHFFDIDWRPAEPALRGKVLSPLLPAAFGELLDQGAIALAYEPMRGAFSLACGALRHPVEPRSAARVLEIGALRPLRDLAIAFAELPAHDVEDPALRRHRRIAQAELQHRLATLAATDPGLRVAIDACVADFNDPARRDRLDALHEVQPYRLASWRSATDAVNYRRFADRNDLAALRVEDEQVFEATHRVPLELAAAGWIDGLHIAHPDALREPAAYMARLQHGLARRRGLPDGSARFRPLYVVIDKVESAAEHLPTTWAIHGTTGHRFDALAAGVFVDRRHAARMDRIWRQHGDPPAGVAGEPRRMMREARREAAQHDFGDTLADLAGALRDIARLDRRARDHGARRLRAALVEVVAALPVYRTYLEAGGPAAEPDRRHIAAALAHARQQGHGADGALHGFVHDMLLGVAPQGAGAEMVGRVRDFALRFQQWAAAVARRGIEEIGLHRSVRLISLNEPGADPDAFGISAAAFHAANLRRARDWPHALVATSGPDRHRTEDVRQRISVLSEQPADWKLALRRWQASTRAWRTRVGDTEVPTPGEQFWLLQTLLGSLPPAPLGETWLPGYRARVEAALTRAARDAALHTSWSDPDPAHEAALAGFVRELFGGVAGQPALADLQARAARLAWFGALNSLSLALLKCTVPGVPVLDPDGTLPGPGLPDDQGRWPADPARQGACLAERLAAIGEALPAPLAPALLDGRLKLWLLARLLAARRRHPDFFASAGYTALRVQGERRRHVIAFARRTRKAMLVVVAGRRFAGLPAAPAGGLPGPSAWSDTRIDLPAGVAAGAPVCDLLTGTVRAHRPPSLRLAEAFAVLPLGAWWIGEPPP